MKQLCFFRVAGSFELAIIRMSRYLDLSQNCVLYGETMLPQDAFFTSDTSEMKLVTSVFEVSKSVAELKLTETELALYSACVLLSPGNYTRSSKRIWKIAKTKTLISMFRTALDSFSLFCVPIAIHELAGYNCELLCVSRSTRIEGSR